MERAIGAKSHLMEPIQSAALAPHGTWLRVAPINYFPHQAIRTLLFAKLSKLLSVAML